ncbi:M23 family metallopeptidase [Gordonia aichiensis]|uniref:M23 family metallopeptidase n=1 Tax=Gordonia aichiensis TaxID=36820 RepID=UPI00058D67F9|nr:M23 family metallopeptidase [Gordonia aichiensis]
MGDLAERGAPGRSTSAVGTVTRRRGAAYDEIPAEEMTAIIPIDDLDSYDPWTADDQQSWSPSSWEPYYRPTRSELTQDILIPEGGFEAYADDPFDSEGAEFDSFAAEAGLTDSGEIDLRPVEKPFRQISEPGRTRTRGKHRVAAPPTALRGGRAALIAMAAGAAVAAGAHAGTTEEAPAPTSTPTNAANVDAAAPAPDPGPGVAAPEQSTQDMSVFTSQLAEGEQLVKNEAARKAAESVPFYVSPIPLGEYQFTSGFAMRWGSMHGGVDFAAPLGTPIHAATDGVIKEAGPASGFGNWIQVQAPDGTITVYGHMFSSGVLVQKGMTVRAGQLIGLVGSDGQSTGPHCHFEVWKNGTTKIDPAPWLAEHGVRMSAYTG